jgi:hypothetical protein
MATSQGDVLMDSLTMTCATMSTAPTIIGATATRFPIGGKIRPGIKVLTQAAERNEEARRIYHTAFGAGRSFDEIGAEITLRVPGLANPLIPKNVPYFTVRRADFTMPEVADLIVQKFGEQREDGVRRLYRFPVLFPSDAWQAIMPHALMCYGTNELKYWSAYSPDGRERYCMTFAHAPVDAGGKRAIRIFGGRKHVMRAVNDGRCDPERCPEYQSKQCNLTGRFVFMIPGIPSLNAIELATNSFYSMNAARQTLETVAFLRGGRISGFLDGKTSFWITKKLHEVAMINEEGQPRRVPQWLIELEAPVDPTQLLRIDGDEVRVAKGERAVALLAGAPMATGDDSDGPAAGPTPQSQETEGIAEPEHPPGELRVEDDPVGALYALVAELKIPRDKFERYAKKKYGAGWNRNANGIRRVAGAVDGFRAKGNGVVAAIDAELDMFTSSS